MNPLNRLLQLARHGAHEDDRQCRDPFEVEVDQDLRSDRRTFRLRCDDGSRVPFNMGGLPYTFHSFTLTVQEKGLRITDVELRAPEEPLMSAAFVAEFVGERTTRGGPRDQVDVTLRLQPSVLKHHFSRLPRQDDPRRVLQVRDRRGCRPALDLENYLLAVWHVHQVA